jgi:prepilin-type processing-associated H-X9-DG protein
MKFLFENLDFENISVENWSANELFIYLPILAHISIHDSSLNSKTYLICFLDSSAQIRRGEVAIVDFMNESTGISLKELYLNQKNNIQTFSSFNGKLKLLTFHDYKFIEKKFINGNLEYIELNYGKRINSEENCIHWYHLHIDYDLSTGEVLDWNIIDLGCLPCAPNSLCDEIVDIGGGGESEQIIRTSDHKVKMFGQHSGYDIYDVFATWRIRGTVGVIPSLNRFTNISFVDGSVAAIFGAGIPIGHYFEILSFTTSTGISPVSARANLNCFIRYWNCSNIIAKSGYVVFTPDNI